ncbi:MAG: CoA ester lyase, partial [Firmicutes bacterium]|nr:CoA ester lyase [Bacillota bacterium]
MRRSMLFIPGANPKQIMFAATMGADSIIFDLEDSVSPAEKDSARILVRNILKALDFSAIEIIVRVNSLNSPFWQEDLKEIVPLKPAIIMTPKSETPEDIKTFADYIGKLEEEHGIEKGSVKIMPLIETALGIENAFLIGKASERVVALFLGGEDYSADMQCKRTKEGNEIDYARKRIVNAARACGIDVYDTPFTDAHDDEGIWPDAAYAKSLGFTGKSAISPRHVEDINAAFSPSEAEVRYAQEVLLTIEEGRRLGKGAVSLRGKMIDKPIVDRAKQT